MRLLELDSQNEVSLTEEFNDKVPPYAILSHTWGSDNDEVTFADLEARRGQNKAGYDKIRFCGNQARKDGIEYFWVDTCCIDKNNHVELSEAITSMFRWYREAVKCYVYLPDVSAGENDDDSRTPRRWEAAFRTSRWFTRGWTLQELLAPSTVEFFSQERKFLGDKKMLVQQIHEITKIPTSAILGKPLNQFSTDERMRWTVGRNTKKVEDKTYCLFGIFDVYLSLIYGERDHAFIRLEEEIAKRSAPPVQQANIHTHWMVSRPTNPLFTGREDLLQGLEVMIRDAVHRPINRVQCRIVISGMGGQGKSEVCLQLTRRLRQLFWLVLWIDISTKDMAERAFLGAAEKMSIPAQNWEDACLGIANLKHPWMLVLDNADDPDIDYQNYFPDSNIGVVIMTTRNDECRDFGTDRAIGLEGLDNNDARDLLLKAARVPSGQHAASEEDAMKVANLLQSHPLALNQAGAYISRGQCTLAEYPDLYQQQRKRLLTYRPKQAQSRYCDVYATFEVSAEMLKNSNTESGEDALQLLSLLAMCEATRFSLSIFELTWWGAGQVPADLDDYAEDKEVWLLTPWHVAHLPSLCCADGETWDSFRLMEAVALLKAYSLITTDPHDSSGYISTHALIHAWARDRQDESTQLQNWLVMGCVMGLAVDRDKVSAGQPRWLLAHIQALMEKDFIHLFAAEEQKLVARILARYGWFLYRAGAGEELLVVIDRMFTRLKLDRARLEPSWIGLYNLRTTNLLLCHKFGEAIPLLEEMVKNLEQSFGEGDSWRLTSYHNLAIAYDDGGRTKEAIMLFERVVSIEARILDEHNPSRLNSQRELARAYSKDGRVSEAIALLEKVVGFEEWVLDEYHPSRLASQHELAYAYKADGQLSEAVALLEKVVDIREQVLDEHHPGRLLSEHLLATYLWESGQREVGLAMMKEVVEVQRRCLREDHPDRLASEHELARFFWNSGQHELGLAMMEKVVEVQRRCLREDHPNRLASEHELARFFWNSGQHELGLTMMEKVVEIRRQCVTEEDGHRIASEQWLSFMVVVEEEDDDDDDEDMRSIDSSLPTVSRITSDCLLMDRSWKSGYGQPKLPGFTWKAAGSYQLNCSQGENVSGEKSSEGSEAHDEHVPD